MSIGDTERATQDRVVSFFKDRDILDYEYVGNLKDAANKNIREDRLSYADLDMLFSSKGSVADSIRWKHQTDGFSG